MKVVAHTGLVPVKALRRFRNNPAGAIFGVDPALAVEALRLDEVELVEIPEGIETIDLPGFGIPEAKAEPVAISTEGLVAIPDDWETAHGSKRAMIAKAILGLETKDKLPAPEGQDVAQFARSVIENELARRAALVPTEPVADLVPEPVVEPVVEPVQEPAPEETPAPVETITEPPAETPAA